jgi:hypothetical protein
MARDLFGARFVPVGQKCAYAKSIRIVPFDKNLLAFNSVRH